MTNNPRPKSSHRASPRNTEIFRSLFVFSILAGVFGVLCNAPFLCTTRAQDLHSSQAAEFFTNRQYSDALKVLSEEIKGKPDAAVAPQNLMIAECYYLTNNLDLAKPCYAKAMHDLPPGSNRTVAEFRLACIAFKSRDYKNADERTSAFLAAHPQDSHIGTLLTYKMLMVAATNPNAGAELENLHQQILASAGSSDYLAAAQADQILTDYYRKSNQTDKAEALYKQLVVNLKKVISERQRDKTPLPPSLGKAHDTAALQLAALYMDRKNTTEASRWLENVQYDLEMQQKSRILLAKVAFEKQDYKGVESCLTNNGFLEKVPPGPLRSDMYLLLGMAESRKPDATPARVESYLNKVDAGDRGYPQAQLALGTMYAGRGLPMSAVRAYTKAIVSREYAPQALLALGNLNADMADHAADPAKAKEYYEQSGRMFSELLTKYSVSAESRQARDKITALMAKGVKISGATNREAMIQQWEKVVEDRKGTAEGAQALISLIRFHATTLADEKTGELLQAPDYKACAAACDRLLDGKTYTGAGMETQNWNAILAEAFTMRATCELASVAPSGTQKGARPVWLEPADDSKAIALFRQAKQVADSKNLDLVKSIELGLLEALFKSDKKEDKELAERRFTELESDYGTDPRFQKLALDMAEWFRAQNRYADAARQYMGVANRSHDIPNQDLVKILFTAGSYYSKAAGDAQRKAGEATYAIYIYPKETVRLGSDILKSYQPLQKTIKIPESANGTSGDEALRVVSKAAGVPLVWSPETGNNRISTYLAQKHLKLKSGPTTATAALAEILDLKYHLLVFDTGISGGTPTFVPPASDEPGTGESIKTIEIYDSRIGEARFAPLARNYGKWNDGKGSDKVMLFNMLQHIEETTRTRVLWAEGIDKEQKMAVESGQPANTNRDSSCAAILASALDPIDLSFKVVRRDLSTEWYEAAKDAFNRVRQIDPKSRYGERALFSVALNFYNQKDYEKMKIVLKEYLKTFDSGSSETFQQACYWIGWALENERNYREAEIYYARAAEERLVIFKPEKRNPLSRDDLKKQFAYDTQFNLMEPVTGSLKDAKLSQFADFLRLNSHVNVNTDPPAMTIDTPVNLSAEKPVPGFKLLCDVLDQLGLDCRAENINPEIAEKAYYRLASVYKKDDLMPQALENSRFLLQRYPDTSRRRQVQGLMLDIYKGLMDYRNVLAMLEELKKHPESDDEKHRLEAETAWIYFDMADYGRAAEAFKQCIPSITDRDQQLSVRDGLAKSLFRMDKPEESLGQFQLLAKEESGLKQYVDSLMTFCLGVALERQKEGDFPQDAMKLLKSFEKLSDKTRENLSAADLARVTWTYYALGLIDLKKNRHAAAIEKFSAAAKSPDDFLAGEAGYRVGSLQMDQGRFDKAREAFEYLLFTGRSPESAVRGTYKLALCLQKLGRGEDAKHRFDEVIERYPISPIADAIKTGAQNQPEGAPPRK